MKIETLQLLIKLLEDQETPKRASSPSSDGSIYIGKRVIVRTYSAGVVYGILEELQGMYARVKDARRIYSWTGAFTLVNLANDGVKSAKLSQTLHQPLELCEAIEILPLSERATQSLEQQGNFVYEK